MSTPLDKHNLLNQLYIENNSAFHKMALFDIEIFSITQKREAPLMGVIISLYLDVTSIYCSVIQTQRYLIVITLVQFHVKYTRIISIVLKKVSEWSIPAPPPPTILPWRRGFFFQCHEFSRWHPFQVPSVKGVQMENNFSVSLVPVLKV